MNRFGLLACVVVFAWAAPAAQAEVVFGHNVYIGGHNVSHQRFDRHRRGEFYLYDRRPRHAGCAWRRNGDGSHTKLCRFQTLH
jgi:hypothetical protein